MISKIVDRVYIGDAGDVDIRNLDRMGINTVLDLRQLNIDLDHNSESSIIGVRAAVERLEVHYRKNRTILVHCHGGIDRAPFIVALWLHLCDNFTLRDAYALVGEKRPQTIEHWEWAEALGVIHDDM